MVEKPLKSARRLGEVRDEPPTHDDEFGLAGLLRVADDGLKGRGREVVTPRRDDKGVAMTDVEGLSDLLFVGASVVAAAHDNPAYLRHCSVTQGGQVSDVHDGNTDRLV
jgi:hypothetical protein